MKFLSQIISGVEVTGSTVKGDPIIRGMSQHSGKIKKDHIFFVSSVESEKYIGEALERGATLICAEKEYEKTPCIVVKDVRKAVAIMSRAFYDYPDRNLTVIGVVGTNGKTSVTHLMNKIFACSGFRTAVIGTLGVFFGEERIEIERTTPDSADFFYYLSEAVKRNVKYVFCEISAHAIYYDKLYGVRCDVCVFTNLTRDHLDFFGTMEKYKKVKESYFCRQNVKCGVINADDEAGREIIKNSDICCVSYGLNDPSDVFAVNIEQRIGTDFVANIFDDILYVHSPLYGKFNVSNLLAALTVGKLFGLGSEELTRAVLSVNEIEGRFNVINWKAKIVIDYAHTPDGMKKVLECARSICEGELICLFGCGGDRDRTKRPIMGKIASELADVTVLTSDNPRSEDPEEIISEIKEGIEKEVFTITNRTDAVNFALGLAKKGDVVVLCGKGAEKYIEYKDGKVAYSDRDACLAYIGREKCHA